MKRRPIEIDLTDDEPGDRVYTCTVCGTTGRWGPEWSWYGSWRQVDEDPSKVVVCCSPVCRRQHSTDAGLVA